MSPASRSAVKVPILLLLILLPAQAQYYRHSVRITGGAGLPRDDLEQFFDISPAFGFSYAYRFHRNFQAEAGLDTVFHAAGIRDYLETPYGPLRIKDYQFMVPLGGRVMVPFARDRFQFTAGGGAAWLRYQEFVRQPYGGYYQIDCPPCRTRSGWGYYALVGFSVALDSGRHFRLGAHTKVYRAETEGDSFGALPSIVTSDAWIVPAAEFSFSF